MLSKVRVFYALLRAYNGTLLSYADITLILFLCANYFRLSFFIF